MQNYKRGTYDEYNLPYANEVADPRATKSEDNIVAERYITNLKEMTNAISSMIEEMGDYIYLANNPSAELVITSIPKYKRIFGVTVKKGDIPIDNSYWYEWHNEINDQGYVTWTGGEHNYRYTVPTKPIKTTEGYKKLVESSGQYNKLKDYRNDAKDAYQHFKDIKYNEELTTDIANKAVSSNSDLIEAYRLYHSALSSVSIQLENIDKKVDEDIIDNGDARKIYENLKQLQQDLIYRYSSTFDNSGVCKLSCQVACQVGCQIAVKQCSICHDQWCGGW